VPHQLISRRDGVTLVELLIACLLVAAVVITLSLGLSKASKGINTNRQRWTATRLASSAIANLKSQPYAVLNTTDSSLFPVTNPTCDCTALDFSVLPSTSTEAAGTTLNTAFCINYVKRGAGNTWVSQCAGDTGYKNILVRVLWTTDTGSAMVSQESMVTPY